MRWDGVPRGSFRPSWRSVENRNGWRGNNRKNAFVRMIPAGGTALGELEEREMCVWIIWSVVWIGGGGGVWRWEEEGSG